MDNGIWALVAMFTFIGLSFLYLRLKINGFFERFKKKKHDKKR